MSKYCVYDNMGRSVAFVLYEASDDLALRAEIKSPRGQLLGYTKQRMLAMVTVFDAAGNEKAFGRVMMPRSEANIDGLISNFHLFGRDDVIGGVLNYEFIKEGQDLLDIAPSVTKGRVVKDDVYDLEQYTRNRISKQYGTAADERGIQLTLDWAIHNQLIMAGSSIWALGLLR